MSLIDKSLPKTRLLFHYDGKLHSNPTTLLSIQSFEDLPESDRSLIKPGSINPQPTHALIFESTIFHPQGGGQPSDTGTISSSSLQDEPAFHVTMARHSITHNPVVLHFGHFSSGNPLSQGATVTQHIDEAKRLLYSRLHTAGHVLGAAVRHLLEKEIEGFDELKASHFPDSAACEFKGSIGGDQKSKIQGKVNEYVEKKMKVEIEFWSKDNFREHHLERLLPSDEDWQALAEVDGEAEGRKGKIRVVNVVGAEVYPCGGTHVDFTNECGKVTVRKIGRQKGNSRVGYAVD